MTAMPRNPGAGRTAESVGGKGSRRKWDVDLGLAFDNDDAPGPNSGVATTAR